MGSIPPKPNTLEVRPQNIPAELRERSQWVLWRWEQRLDGSGVLKWTKPPFGLDGSYADSTSLTTWTTFIQAFDAYQRDAFDGVGFVLTSRDPYVGLDLDHCRNPETGQIAPWAAEFVFGIADSAEIH